MRKLRKVFSISVIIVILSFSTAFFSIYFSVKLDKEVNRGGATVYDAAGNELTPPSSIRTYVKYEDISPHIINAFVAIEDKRFFEHNGIDFIRIGGATVSNLKSGRIKEGGSTITQQLAKNTQLTSNKTLQRKIKEIKLARDIEKRYSKAEILELYLNAIYFGNSIYGINAACDRFFNKKPSGIQLFEAAILAGVVKNPNKNSPLRHPENADLRKNLVLRLMKEQGYIDDFEYEKNAAKVFLKSDGGGISESGRPYYNAAIAEAAKLLKLSEKGVIESGVKIFTCFDKKKQDIMYKGFLSGEFEADGYEYSALMLDNASGGVSAYFATHSFPISELRRQPGSAVKPILVYAPALQLKHITPATPYNDAKTAFGEYLPSNYKDKYLGVSSIRKCVTSSSNVVSVKLLDEIGVDYGKRIASDMGLRFADNDMYLALALGGMTKGVTSQELAESYMCLANGGIYKQCYFVEKITDTAGNVLFTRPRARRRAIDEEAAYLMTHMLIDTARGGTAQTLSAVPFQIAAKTGTVGGSGGGNTDAWSLSYTSQSTVCVWYGNLSGKPNTSTVTGGGLPTLVAKYIHEAQAPPPRFNVPDNIVEMKIDTLATKEFNKIMLATQNTPHEYQAFELFDAFNAPAEYSPLYNMPVTKMNVESLDGSCAEISFDALSAYKYRVIRKNLSTGETDVVYETSGEHGRLTLFDELNGSGIFSYGIEVTGKYGFLGVAEERFLLAG